MPQISPETKQRVTTVVGVAKTVVRYGFIPFVLYLGFKKGADEGNPPLTLTSLIWM